jgi:hypothetical protein
MKAKLGTDTPGTYTFDAAAKTVTFSGLRQAITLSNIYLITNSTTNTIIYNFASSAKGNAGFTNNVLTLDFDTTAMSNTDDLQIILDVESLEETLQTLLRRMNKLLESNTVVDSRLRQRVTLDALPTIELTNTVPVSGTVTATANINTAIATQAVANSATNPYTLGSISTSAVFEGPLHQLWRVADESRNLYASAIRSKLVFS